MGENINKKELVHLVSEKLKQMNPAQKTTKKEVESVLEAMIKAVTEALQQEQSIFIGFGSFTVRRRKETIKTNPKDVSKKIKVPSKNLVKFKASEKLNDSLN